MDKKERLKIGIGSILYNIYPTLLQQYIRLRLGRFRNRESMLPVNLEIFKIFYFGKDIKKRERGLVRSRSANI